MVARTLAMPAPSRSMSPLAGPTREMLHLVVGPSPPSTLDPPSNQQEGLSPGTVDNTLSAVVGVGMATMEARSMRMRLDLRYLLTLMALAGMCRCGGVCVCVCVCGGVCLHVMCAHVNFHPHVHV